MKKINLKHIILLAGLIFFGAGYLQAQTSEEIIDLLLKKQLIQQSEADSLKAVIKLKEKENQEHFDVFADRQLQLGGYTQVRYQSFQEQAGQISGADLRRVKVGLTGFITDDWQYRLLVDFAKNIRTIDAYIMYILNDQFKVTAGQFKLPFSLENLISDSKSESIDRAQVVEALVARTNDIIGNQSGDDIGVKVSGDVLENNGSYLIDYALGIFNGAGINNTDNNNAKDFCGRLILHPVNGLDFGGSYYDGYDMWGTPLQNHVRTRYGFELKYVYDLFAVSSEYISGRDASIRRDGWYVQLLYFFIPEKLQGLLKCDTYDPDKSVSGDRTTNYTFGVNYYFNEWAKIQADYVLRREEVTQIKNDVINIQLQIGF
jgi:phosphate-selective porin